MVASVWSCQLVGSKLRRALRISGDPPTREAVAATPCHRSRVKSIAPPRVRPADGLGREHSKARPRNDSLEHKCRVCKIIGYATQLPGGYCTH
jgi:hypothetical protein